MTLLISLVKPHEGVWQCADHLISRNGNPVHDDARKQIGVRCRDGVALLSYTGLAHRWPGHTAMSDLIRQLIRGDNRTVEGHLAVLRDGLNRHVARTAWRDEMLVVHAVAIVGGGGPNRDDDSVPGRPWVYEIANREKDGSGRLLPTPKGRFTFKRIEVNEPVWLAGGSGERFIPAQDRHELTLALSEPPGTRDVHELLAAVNRRVAANRASGVSPWCQTYSLPPSGVTLTGQDHRMHGEPPFDERRPAPYILFGLDFTETISLLAQRLRLLEQNRGEGDPAYDALDPTSKEVRRRRLKPRD